MNCIDNKPENPEIKSATFLVVCYKFYFKTLSKFKVTYIDLLSKTVHDKDIRSKM